MNQADLEATERRIAERRSDAARIRAQAEEQDRFYREKYAAFAAERARVPVRRTTSQLEDMRRNAQEHLRLAGELFGKAEAAQDDAEALAAYLKVARPQKDISVANGPDPAHGVGGIMRTVSG